MSEYNAQADGAGSYLAAIAAKKARGDDYYLLPHQDLRLIRSRFKGITCLTERAGAIQRGGESSGSPFASRAMRGPIVIHEDFSSSLQGVHIQDASSIDDFDSGAEPGALRHGGAA